MVDGQGKVGLARLLAEGCVFEHVKLIPILAS